MSSPTYPLAPTALGEARAYEVEGLSLGPAWNYAVISDRLPVSLSPNPVNGGWFVRTAAGALGTLVAEAREDYPDLMRVLRSGFQPATVAEISPAGRGRLRMEVRLPTPPFAVPRNNLPERALLLPPGTGVLLDTIAADGISAAELAEISPAQLLVTLTRVAGEIVAVYNNRPLGVLPEDWAPAGFAEQVAQLHRAGTPLAARVFCGEELIALDAAPELIDAAQPLPELSEPAPRPPHPTDLTGEWDAVLDTSTFSLDPPTGHRRLEGPQ